MSRQIKIDQMINDVTSIIRQNIQDLLIESKELEDTNKAILHLPVVKKVIYAYEDSRVTTSQTKIEPSTHDEENILSTKINALEEKVNNFVLVNKIIGDLSREYNKLFEWAKSRDEKIEKMQGQMESIMTLLTNKPDTNEPIKLEIKELDKEEPLVTPTLTDVNDLVTDVNEVVSDTDDDDVETETTEFVEEEEEQEDEEEEDEEEEKEDRKEEATIVTTPLEEPEQEEGEEEEVFEIEIDDITYFATHEENGILYEVDENGDPGKKVGVLKDGEPFFS